MNAETKILASKVKCSVVIVDEEWRDSGNKKNASRTS